MEALTSHIFKKENSLKLFHSFNYEIIHAFVLLQLAVKFLLTSYKPSFSHNTLLNMPP